MSLFTKSKFNSICFNVEDLWLDENLNRPASVIKEQTFSTLESFGAKKLRFCFVLSRMGLIFSPGLIMLNILKLVIIMYLRSWAVMVTNVPPKRIFKASHRFYLFLLLVMLFLCMLAVGYAAVE